jgi:hypothetical protein
MCGGPAAGEGWLDPGSLHRAVLHGLQPDNEYFYTYGSEVRTSTPHTEFAPCARFTAYHALACCGCRDSTSPFMCWIHAQEHGWSEEASFVTPPPVGPESSVSMLAIADMGQAEVGC